MTIVLAIFMVALHLLLPIYFAYLVLKGDQKDKAGWLLHAVTGSAFVAFLTIGGRWDWVSMYLRYVPAILFIPALLIGARRVRGLPFYAGREGRQWLGTGMAVFEALLAIAFLVLTVRGQFYAEQAVRLSFPLQDGEYYVGQGGASVAVNYHHVNRAQAYAADIVELNELGLRAQGIYPQDREQFAIYGETVVSPCEGTVTAAVDGFQAQDPPQSDPEHPAGNHVMITCDDTSRTVTVLLAHLQADSVAVQEGQTVGRGQRLGRVGNTGNTTEPHLHVHAVEGRPDGPLQGDGVPILFDGTFPVRNTLFQR